MLHGIHCIQSCCIKSTAFNRDALGLAAWNKLHSIRLHGIHCIQWGCILPCCMEFTAFNHNAWNPLHSIGMLWAMLHKIHRNYSGCSWRLDLDGSRYNRDQLPQNARNHLHSMTLHGIHCIPSGCFGPYCIKSTACNHAALKPLHSIMLHKIHCIQ